MSAGSSRRSDHQFLCSICLDVFTDPVTVPCGHNFCKHCITEHWDTNGSSDCPLCKESFQRRPPLRVNTFIREMVAEFRCEAEQRSSSSSSSSSSEQQDAKPGEVPCDACTGTKLKALKSCLVCLASYCETHLKPHLTVSSLKRHQLAEPVENLEDRMCSKHFKPLELFCKTEQTCVCLLCSVVDHRTHEIVPLREEYEARQAELKKTEAEIKQMRQKRRLKIQEIKESAKISRDAAEGEKAEGVQVFVALREAVVRGLNEFVKEVEDKQETTEKQAEDFIRDLEEEISELKKRSCEVKQLSRSEDHLHLLRSFSSLNPAPPARDWTEVSVRPPPYEGTAARAVATLEETLGKKMKRLLAEAELRRVQRYAVDVTLNPRTAHDDLRLSDEGKRVQHKENRHLKQNIKTFYHDIFVLGNESFSSGRFYFQVEVKGNTYWALGLVKESVDRKGLIEMSSQDGCWILWLRKRKENKALAPPSDARSDPKKVGVFLDHQKGLISFYDVDAAALIRSFTGCRFPEKLYPIFSLYGDDSGSLSICPVNQTV
ncbi:E3 ubiquitin-protein ligase TRIM11-like [Odontesthes bonariensis]|uniref:E3 ubiquitin-protein ligase TRIM11-like n=1 Tax=Odontesthes bonariensis TaxID=219752 RepID=UPI003F586EDC